MVTVLLRGMIYYVTIINLLYFKLSVMQKFIIYVIVIIGTFMETVFGNYATIIILSCLYIYLNRLKDNRLINFMVLIYGFMFDKMIDKGIRLGFRIINMEVEHYFLIYWILMNIAVYLLTYALKGIVGSLIKIPKRCTIHILLSFLIFLSIFDINISVGAKVTDIKVSIFFNFIVFMIYFFTFIKLTSITIAQIEKTNMVVVRNEALTDLQRYTTRMEEAYKEIRGIRHDYMNILLAMKDYIDNKDLEGATAYFYSNVVGIDEKITKDKHALNCLSNIKIIELKSIIFSKCMYAMKSGVDISIEVEDEIDRIDINKVDLIRIIGIFMDNAIEAAAICDKSRMNMVCIQDETSVQFIIQNSYNAEKLSYDGVKRKYCTTKGNGRGIGLDNVESILKRYRNIILNTRVGDMFIQELYIMDVAH